jgi:hypothetical protein
MPLGPPTSPLTASHFWSWAFFDASVGPERETIGTCVLALAEVVPMHAEIPAPRPTRPGISARRLRPRRPRRPARPPARARHRPALRRARPRRLPRRTRATLARARPPAALPRQRLPRRLHHALRALVNHLPVRNPGLPARLCLMGWCEVSGRVSAR